MPRPRRRRRVCELPQRSIIGPLNVNLMGTQTSIMSVDEFETIRLIDHEGLNQEECAERMDVARTTVQRIYNDARQKIALSLVEGKILKIEGGDYLLCAENEPSLRCGRCRRNQFGKGNF